MTRVCLVGAGDVDLRFELLSRETSRGALSTYDLQEPYANTVAVETVSLGAAVSLLNDLDWYLVRFVDEALVLEPSISDEEWLSRHLASAVRDEDVSAAETGEYLKVYGVVPADAAAGGATGEETDADDPPRAGAHPDPEAGAPGAGTSVGAATGDGTLDEPGTDAGPGKLVEPMYVTRRDGDIPAYDLRDVEETVVVRVTEEEFGA